MAIAYVELQWLQKALDQLEKAGVTVIHETLENDELLGGLAESSKR
jgi:hypothetical protein